MNQEARWKGFCVDEEGGGEDDDGYSWPTLFRCVAIPCRIQEKLQVAKQLSKLGVDIIEAGFPIASPGDFSAVKRIAETVGCIDNPPIICGLARALKKDILVSTESSIAFMGPRLRELHPHGDSLLILYRLCLLPLPVAGFAFI